MAIYLLLIITLAIVLFVNYNPEFGDHPKGDLKAIIENSPNYVNGKFQNLITTKMGFEKDVDFSKYYVSDTHIGKRPNKPLVTIKFDKYAFADNKKNSITWLGHSTILMKLENKVIILDPIFNRASPFPFLLGPTPFKYENKISAKDLPDKIDFILITHDHYDHLDYNTIKDLISRVGQFLVPLGVKAHLLKWGVPDNKIKEFDWYDNNYFDEIYFIFTPTRHFSGRALRDRFATLWGGWIIKTISNNLFICGDGGYSNDFKKIGDKYGPFDVVFIENGAYNPRWQYVHLFPEQSVQASLDAQAKLALPIHWGKFNLSYHNWREPIERFVSEAERIELPFITPKIGQTFIIGEESPQEKWWENTY